MQQRTIPTSKETCSKLLVSVEEAAQMLSVGRSLVYKLVMSKQVVSVKIGRTRRIPVFALEQFIAQQVGQQGVN
jgi:excisionase family DNA binding protein